MGKEFKNIDDLFRSELGGEVTKAPAFVKGNIDKALGFNKNYKRLMIIGAFAIISTAAISIGYFNNHTSFQHKLYKQSGLDTLLRAEQSAAVSNKHQNNNNDFSLNNEILTSTNLQFDQLSQENNQRQNLNFSNTANKKDDLKLASNKFGNPTIKSNDNDFNTDINDNKSTTSSDLIAQGLNKNDVTVETITNNDVVINNNHLDNTQQNKDLENDINNQFDNTTEAEITATSDNKILDNLTTENPQLELIDNTDTVSINNDNLEVTDNNTIDSTLTINDVLASDSSGLSAVDTEIEILNKPEKDYKPWMLSLTSGINFANSAYSSNNMSEQTYYENSVNDKLGNETNFDFSYRLKNGLTFGSGLGMTQYKDNFNFTITNTVLDSMPETIYEYDYEYEYGYIFSEDSIGGTIDSIYTIIDSTGTISDSSTVYNVSSTDSKENKVGINKATYVTIPIHFGTQIIYRKFQIDLFAALRFNFLLGSTGGYVNNGVFSSFDMNNSIYRSFYVDWSLGTKVHYNFWKNLYVTGTVRYRPISGMAFKDLSINKSFDYIHTGIGLSIRL